MQKRYLMAPGPTPVAPETLLAMAEPMIHHRSPQFSAILAEVEEGLKFIFQTKNDVLILVASGTGAMEGAVTNFLSAGDKALVVRGGKFGERWEEICTAYGVKAITIDVEWGKSIRPELIEAALKAEKDIKAVYIQAHETSTGVKHPVEAIGKIVNQFPGTILIVDAISALGVYDLKTDDWHIDVLVSGSQKALMLPPGLAFASVSEKAWGMNKTSGLPKYYFDFAKERKSLAKNTGAYTSAVTLIIGLQQVLRQVKVHGFGGHLCPEQTALRGHQGRDQGPGVEILCRRKSIGSPDCHPGPGRYQRAGCGQNLAGKIWGDHCRRPGPGQG